MPITRYRDVSEMPPLPLAGSDDLAARIREVWSRAARLAGLAPHRGVQRFASVEDAQAARLRATRERVAELRASRERGGGGR